MGFSSFAMSNSKPSPDKPSPLTGTELLSKVKELNDAKISSLAKILEATGYYTVKADGSTVQHKAAFYKAMSEAQVGEIHDDLPSRSGTGRAPTNRLTVGSNGVVALSACYSKQIGLEPGEKVKVEVYDTPTKVSIPGECIVLRFAELDAEEEKTEPSKEGKSSLRVVA